MLHTGQSPEGILTDLRNFNNINICIIEENF
jgi:hypothetical protein